jgi:hypothetical protein
LFGQMVHTIKVSGKIVEKMEKENLWELMELFMKAIGKMENIMVMEN